LVLSKSQKSSHRRGWKIAPDGIFNASAVRGNLCGVFYIAVLKGQGALRKMGKIRLMFSKHKNGLRISLRVL
jgi:hypothetical protein